MSLSSLPILPPTEYDKSVMGMMTIREKAINVMLSCENVPQLDVAKRYILLCQGKLPKPWYDKLLTDWFIRVQLISRLKS
jgi:hypothetical protein